jgi:tetratricopeptide (TPR) repeat protein
MKRVVITLAIIVMVMSLFAQQKKVVLLDIEKYDSGATSVANALTKTDLPAMFNQSGQYSLVDGKEVSKAFKKSGFKLPSEMARDDMKNFGAGFDTDLVVRGSVTTISNTQFKLTFEALSVKTMNMKRFMVDLPINSTDRLNTLNTELLPKINDMAGGELDREFGVCERDFAANNIDAAEAGLVRYISIDPNRAKAYLLLGRTRVQKGKYDLAITDFTNGLKVAPNDIDLLNDIANAYNNQGRRDEAVAALERLADLQPSDATPWLRIASIYNEAGDKDKTLEALRGALQKSPDNARIRLVLANQLYDAQLYDEALPEYERCADSFPDDETIDKRLGTCYEKTGKYDDAIARYNTALQNNPNDTRTLAKRAGVYLQAAHNAKTSEESMQKAEASALDYHTLLTKDANNTAYILAMSDAYLTAAAAAERLKDAAKNKQNTDAGIKALQDALRIAPENAKVHLRLASLYYDQGKAGDAQRSAETAIQKDPALVEAYFLMSRIYQNMGIDKYNQYVDLDSRYQNSSEVGSKLDALRNQRSATKREANALFQKAAGYIDTAKTKTTDADYQRDLQRARETLSQYIHQTEKDFFDK